MNEKEAREIQEPKKYPWDGPKPEEVSMLWYSKGYLEAIEKAKGLVEALEYIIEHQEYVSGTMAELSTTRRIAKEALAKWEKEK